MDGNTTDARQPAEPEQLDARLRDGLRRLLELRSENSGTTGVHDDHVRALVRMGELLTAKPEGYGVLVRTLAMPIVNGATNDMNVLARTHLAIGQTYMDATDPDSVARARTELERAWSFCGVIHPEARDITLVVMVGTQLAVAIHRQGATAAGEAQLIETSRIMTNHVFASDIEKRGVESIFEEAAALIEH